MRTHQAFLLGAVLAAGAPAHATGGQAAQNQRAVGTMQRQIERGHTPAARLLPLRAGQLTQLKRAERASGHWEKTPYRFLRGAHNEYQLNKLDGDGTVALDLALAASGHVGSRGVNESPRAEKLANALRFAATNQYDVAFQHPDGKTEQLAIPSTGLVTRSTIRFTPQAGVTRLLVTPRHREGGMRPNSSSGGPEAYPEGRIIDLHYAPATPAPSP